MFMSLLLVLNHLYYLEQFLLSPLSVPHLPSNNQKKITYHRAESLRNSFSQAEAESFKPPILLRRLSRLMFFLPLEGWLRAQQREKLQSSKPWKGPLTPGTPAAGPDVATMIYRLINGAFPNNVCPPSREQAMNFLSVKPIFCKIFLFVIEKSLSISGWRLVGMRVRVTWKN